MACLDGDHVTSNLVIGSMVPMTPRVCDVWLLSNSSEATFVGAT